MNGLDNSETIKLLFDLFDNYFCLFSIIFQVNSALDDF